MVHTVGQHQLVLNVGRMCFLVQWTSLQRSKDTNCIIFTHVGRFANTIIHYNTRIWLNMKYYYTWWLLVLFITFLCPIEKMHSGSFFKFWFSNNVFKHQKDYIFQYLNRLYIPLYEYTMAISTFVF
jgi:hypothetical protein